MTYLPPGLPRWDLRVGDAPRIPGLQQVLLLSGSREITLEGAPPMTWSCCGIYKVTINGGGPISWLPEPPPATFTAPPPEPLRPWRGLEELARWLDIGGERVIVNPLSWQPLTPMVSGDNLAPPCSHLSGLNVSTAFIPPLRGAVPSRSCGEARLAGRVEARLGRFRLGGPWRRAHGSLAYLGECTAFLSPGGLVALDPCSLEVETGIYDYSVEPLYSAVTVGYHAGARFEAGPFNALAVGSPEASWISLASPKGVTIEARPGRILVHSEGPLRASIGRGPTAARLLVESAVEWRQIEASRRGFGNMRASRGAVYLYEAGPGEMRLALFNPEREPGMLEVRLPAPRGEARSRTPLGETVIPLEGDLARYPLAPGLLGTLHIRLSGKTLLMRLRRIRGR